MERICSYCTLAVSVTSILLHLNIICLNLSFFFWPLIASLLCISFAYTVINHTGFTSFLYEQKTDHSNGSKLQNSNGPKLDVSKTQLKTKKQRGKSEQYLIAHKKTFYLIRLSKEVSFEPFI